MRRPSKSFLRHAHAAHVSNVTLYLNCSKVRISLGLRPLSPEPAPSKTGEGKTEDDQPVDKDAIAEENYRRKREEDRRSKEEKEIKDRIAK